MTRLLYTLLLHLSLPLVLLRLVMRARRQPAYLHHLGERFGRPAVVARLPLIWIHAVSVGETRAAKPLIDALLDRYPEHQILLTCTTPTGRESSQQLFGARVLRCYLPYDYPFAIARFLKRMSPQIGIIMETEIWPNLFAACRKRAIPLFLANARLSENSARGYARFSRLSRPALALLEHAAAQSDADAQRLRSLGVQDVSVLGNLKFDLLPPTEQLQAGRKLRAWLGDRPVLLLASTREGEEALILDAMERAGPLGELLLMVVPRHPQRFDAVAAMVAQRGIALQRRAQGGELAAATQLLIGDTMGEMFAYYAAADVAFVGGSLVPLGGQNLIEACAVGTPVLLGPHTFNFSEASQQAIACGAAQRVSDADQLLDCARALMDDASRRRAMGEAGRAFAIHHRGATARTLLRIEAILAGERR